MMTLNGQNRTLQVIQKENNKIYFYTIKLLPADIANTGELSKQLQESLVIVSPLQWPHHNPAFPGVGGTNLWTEISWALVKVKPLKYFRRIQEI